MQIIFVTGSISQPRVLKRIQSIKDAGFAVSVYAYDRGVYNCNVLPGNIPLTILGTMRDGRDYLTKFRLNRLDAKKIVEKEGKEGVLYYLFGFIETFLFKMQDIKYVYEVSDILYGYKKFNVIRPILKILDRWMMRSSFLTVMTSQGFADYFFGKGSNCSIIVQPNKLNSFFCNRTRVCELVKNVGHLVFAFIGAIRYTNTILSFAKIIGRLYPMHEFHFYGESSMSEYFKDVVREFDNVKFFGKFRNPEDLAEIYSRIDVVVACYENESLNERIAEPNKLYEAMFFCKPIVVSKNTFLEEQVNKFNCGYAINAYSDDDIKHFINSLSIQEINSIKKRCNDMRSSDLIDDSRNLIERLRSFK